MRITNIRAFQPPTPGSPPDWRTQLGQIVVELTTDAGLTGIGVGGGGAASIHVIQTVLRDLLVGRDNRACCPVLRSPLVASAESDRPHRGRW